MSNLRFGGMPTDAEVRMLRDRFGVPEEGTPMPYNEIAQTIRQTERSNRYYTVVNAWRRFLRREHNVILRAGGGCFRAMSPSQRVDHSGDRVKSGLRTIRRAEQVLIGTDRARLTDEEKRRADHTQLIASALTHAARVESQKPVPALPEAVKARN